MLDYQESSTATECCSSGYCSPICIINEGKGVRGLTWIVELRWLFETYFVISGKVMSGVAGKRKFNTKEAAHVYKFAHDTDAMNSRVPNIEISQQPKISQFHRELDPIDCEPERTWWIEQILNWKGDVSIPMIPVLLVVVIDQVPIHPSMRWCTAAEYDRSWDTSLLRNQLCKVEFGQVNSCRAIEVNRTYWKFSDSYSFAAVATNLVCKAFYSPRV